MEKILFTPQGLETIKQELAHLKGSEPGRYPRHCRSASMATCRRMPNTTRPASASPLSKGVFQSLEDDQLRRGDRCGQTDGREGYLGTTVLLPMRIRTRNLSSILSAPMRRTSIAGLSRHRLSPAA